ncbi:MAG TPA: YcxB family protein [Candidatus Angelobacter sp.]|nr:YcxB family protein [Candidatus Angelobacter sp.]
MGSNLATAENQITIDYALTRSEAARSYLQAIRQSPEYLRRVVMLAAICGLVQMCFRVLGSRHFGGPEILSAVIVFAVILALLPILLFLTAKTNRRTLTISPDGISTSIGTKSAEIPWKSVKVVKDSGTFILIARTNGNAFFIPNRAFVSPDNRARFMEQIGFWRGSSK